MKRNFYYIIGIMMATILFVASCEKEDLPTLPDELKTSGVTNVTSNSADVKGFVVAGNFTEYGVCWGTSENPTTADNKATTKVTDKAQYVVTLTNLNYATTYYARAYTVGKETIYGEQVSFTTLPVAPSVTTSEPTNITGVTAVSGGNVTDDGGATITARGICWGTEENPTVENSITTEEGTTGEFVSTMSGLSGLTTYYVRAYATNEAGTSYGKQFSFTTLVAEITWYVPGNHQGWNPGTAPALMNTPENPNTITGYVWLDGEFKFTAERNWDDGNWGDNGGDGTLDEGGANMSVPEAGLYRITVDFAAMTYVLEPTNWGLIGSATPGGWDSDSDLTYSKVSGKAYVTLPLTAEEIKFRANDDWTLNYGDNDADGSLEEGGANIAVPSAGNYTVVLDLSKPANYTYELISMDTPWGIIGSATPDGWNSDQDMTVKGSNWVITLDLTEGEIKFRANDDWTDNFGDSGADGTLDAGGDNIKIAEAGNYTITMNLVDKTYTIVKN